MARRWTAVLARTGVPTGDGRIIDPMGLTNRELPMPLMWQEKTEDGHGGAVTVGAIDKVTYANGMVLGEGTLLELFPERARLIELIESKVVGPSIDLADNVMFSQLEDGTILIDQASIGGATLVPIEAFSDVSIEMSEGESAAVEGTEESNRFLHASAAAPVLPPIAWFAQPDVDRLTPLTVSDTGRVFGHIAGRDTCHVGLPGCVTPPMGYSNYEYFHVGAQATQEGVTLPVGTFVAGPRHASPELAFQAAQQHYDDPTAVAAKVVVGEDEFGIWAAGWMPPEVSEESRRVFLSSPVSGDWRRIGGRLELIAVCSVNTPGFPVPRAKVSFSYAAQEQNTLIAAGFKPQVGEVVEGSEESNRSLHEMRARWAWMTTGMEA